MQVKFKRLNQFAVIPTRTDSLSAGWDLSLPTDPNYFPTLNCGETKVFKLGFALQLIKPIPMDENFLVAQWLPAGFQFQITPRSGNAAKKSLGVLNSPGIVDEGFVSELGVILHNHGSEPIDLKGGDKIAQMILMPYYKMDFIEVNELDKTDRGSKGFGESAGIVG